MIFSRIAAGEDQSIRRSTRKPRLNHEPKRCWKSRSTTARPAIPARGLEKVGAHRDQRRRAAGRAIETTEQFLPARLGSVVDLARREFSAGRREARHRVLDPSSDRARNRSASARKNALFVGLGKAAVAARGFRSRARRRRPRRARSAARCTYRRASRPVLRVARPCGQLEDRAAALGDRGQKIGKEGAVHLPPCPPRNDSRHGNRPGCRGGASRIKPISASRS